MNRFHKIVLLLICFSIQYTNAQAFTFDLKAYTSQSNSADTPGEIGVSFLVNGVWTQTEPFFTGANKGDLKTKSFTTSTHPTKLKFLSNSNNNAWGYWKVVFADNTILLDPNGENGSPIGTVPYWVDGDSSEGTPTFQEHNLAVTYTFTNAGATGRLGPSQSQINLSYVGTNLGNNVTIQTQGIQEWVVPVAGFYKIEVLGASGGNSAYGVGGKGASMSGNFFLGESQLLKIIPGQMGLGNSNGAGGGGGSFVINAVDSTLLIASGGGGGAGGYSETTVNAHLQDGKDAVTETSGTNSQIPGPGQYFTALGEGGDLGNGGTGGKSHRPGGGGAGFLSSGTVGVTQSGGNPGNPGLTFTDGFIGGTGEGNSANLSGGFGGGGGSGLGGGGGGGYSGGGGGIWTGYSSADWGHGGGGGGSYNSGTDQTNSIRSDDGHGKIMITFLPLPTYTFTNAGATGRTGPSQSQINLSYAGTNLENNVNIQTQGIQEWAIPVAGSYKIEVFGASGGSSTYGAGGKGAYMSGKFILEESQPLKIIAGQTGIGNSNGGGGGGGSFVVNGIDSTLLIAAGGGGGAGGYLETTINPHLQDGKDAVSGTNGTDAQTQGPGAGFTSLGQGGSSGNGGTGGVSNHPGAGGAGFLTNGTMGQNTAGYHAFAGVSFSSGFVGGDGRGKPNGGFGGGGSTSHGGGGGGGYSGGGGGVWTHPGGADWGHGGGGGGSFNSGTDQNNTSGVNIGHGKVIITFLASANEAPVISQGTGPISKVTSEDTLTTWTTSELNATDSDTNSAQLSWSILTPPSNGTATVDGNGTSPQILSYLPDANFHGNDSFSVMVSDGDANDSITINLTINQVNDATVLVGDFNSTIDAGTIASGDINATDPDGLTDGSYFAVTQNPLHGSALVDQIDGNWTYIPQSDFFGDDNFTVTITDDLDQSITQLINIFVTPTTSIIYTFTNAGATGREGPEQSNINSAYLGTNLESKVTINTRGIQEWTVPASGTYRIEAWGASGGNSGPNGNGNGGHGAKVNGNFILQKNSILRLIIGQQGLTAPYEAGGGGGTFIFFNITDTFPLLVAGGGGGGGRSSDGKNAEFTNNGSAGAGSNFGTGGNNGLGGSKGSHSTYAAAGGGGWLTDGEDGVDGRDPTYMDGSGGLSPRNGATGGNNRTQHNPLGGFGGGGAGRGHNYAGAGGGGGYSGGGAGAQSGGYGGGGGGSFNSGTDQNNTSGVNIGHGKVIITFLSSLIQNEAPVISQGIGPISKVTLEDTLTTWTTSELNATDSDTNASKLSWSVLTPPTNGTATVDGNGTSPQSFTYLPDANFHGSDSFSVMVSDGDKNDSLTINLTINQINDSTIISGDFNSTIDSGTVALGDLNASDPDGLTDGSYFSVSHNPSHGNAIIHPSDGNWTYIPQSNFFGDDNFTVTITDDLNQSITQLINIFVTPTTSIIYTFTNAGATGRQGPTQANIDSSYTGTNLAGIVTINTTGIQEWVVPASGIYRIEALGASGGDGGDLANGGNDGDYSGGLGAKMSGDFSLTAGEKLYLLVGQQGLSHYNYNGSGGGGSFVAKGAQLAQTSPLLVAGGGGGGGIHYNQDATTSESGLDAKTNNGPNSLGGTNGQGGQGGTSQGSGGGGGFFGDGSGAAYSASYHGKSFQNGGLGGDGLGNEGDGGFGGGGGFHYNHTGGGGGGGYSGGAGGGNYHTPTYTGGGGGSFNSGTNQLNTAGANQGHGKIIISIFSSSPTNESPVIFQGTGPISKVTSEDTLTTWSASELNATDSDTNLAQLSWSVLTPPSNGTAVVDGNGTSPQTFTYLPDANFHGSDSFSVMVSDGDANDSITINLTINPVDDPAVITDGLLSSSTFSFTGANQTYAIPSGTEKLKIKLWGAGGGTGNVTHTPKGGGGGYTESTITVPQDEDSLTVIVGEKGNKTWSSSNVNSTYGGGGGSGSDAGNSGGQGGGRSAIRLSDGTEILTAGGGGGGGFGSTSRTGGEGGGLSGKQGHNSGNVAGHGGAQTTGGLRGIGDVRSGETGLQYQGGRASIQGAGHGGGGGGGGYWGGGGGGGSSGNHGAGGGGSGFVGRNGTDFLQGENYGSVTSPADLTSRTDSVTGISYEFTKCLQANGDNPAIILGDYGKSDHHGFVQIFSISSIASSISKSLTEDSYISGDLDASDADGMTDGSYFSISQVAQHGTLSINSETGAWIYTPDNNFYGQDQAQITITDDLDGSSVIDFLFSVTPVEDPAVIYGDFNQSINEDSIALGDLNATDLDGLSDGSYFAIFSQPTNGIAAIDPTDGNWTYIPHPHFFGDDNFTISITDDQNHSYYENIQIVVLPVDDPILISGDFNQSIDEDGFAFGNLIALDIDGLSDGSYYAINTPPSHGSASIDPTNGNWSYLPHPHFFGDDNFTISITDDLNQSYFEVIEVFVHPVDDPAIINGDFNQSIDEDGIAYGNLIALDIDGLTDGSYYAITNPPSHGSASIDPTDGNWTYLPHPHFFGDDNFTISITDDQNHSYFENIQILVHPVDDPAIISGNLQATTYLDISSHGQIIAKDIDGLAKDIIFEISRLPKKGIAEIDPSDGNWTYLPTHQDFGDDMFEISVTDIDGNKTFQTITLNAQINHPLLKTITPILSAEESIILQGEVISTGGSIILDTGFWLDTSPTFSNPNKIYSVADKNGSLESAISIPQEIVFIKSFAITSIGEFFGQTIRYNPFSSKKFWQAHAIPMDADWMQSDWFGMFTPVTENWIYHLRMEWLFISDFTPKNLWVWSEQQDWIWTTEEVFPFFYSNKTGNWLYLLPTKLGDKTFYNYETEELE